MQVSRTNSWKYFSRHGVYRLAVLAAMLIFVVWSLLTMNQAEEEKFRFEALSRCRVLEVAIADIMHGNSEQQITLVQQRIDKLVLSDPRIVRLSVIAMAKSGSYTHIASSLPSRVGKPAHEEDLEVIVSGEIIYLDEEYKGTGALDITYPVHDFEGRIVALLGYTVRRESSIQGSMVRGSLGLLALSLLFFYLWQARTLSRQNAAIQHSLQHQLKTEESLREMGDSLHQAKKMEAIGMLAGGVAHDLNNMLTGIVGYPELMLQDENLSPRQLTHLKTIRDTGFRIADVVSDMQVLSRSSAASQKIFDLNQVVEGYLSSPEFAEKQTTHQVQFGADLDPRLPRVEGKDHHLRKVVMNLLVNAMEAAGPHGQVDIHTSGQNLAEPLDGYEMIPTGAYVRIRISDSGSGIDPEYLRQIFEPFFSRKVMGASGTGLGLAICWSIVHDHGGYFDLHCNNPGTIFDVYLPAYMSDEDTSLDSLDSLALAQGSGESVMVIDDEAGPRQVGCSMLRHLGYEVIEAESGEAAVAILGQRKVDLLLLDMIMDPGIGGLETYRRILTLHPGQKALIVSGQAETGDVDDALCLGIGEFLKKPLSLQHLATAVSIELRRQAIPNSLGPDNLFTPGAFYG